ncbi:hypothetical protein SASPL_124011 [Salvia splendens]|uniref:Uncharacterized protein n=1 Tax=Salvia splendens TaxID=180675 RepID=A0A8X8ZTR4_SALSN|nr:hypothetical protein SASPL_124011 [Salvia splendens]
MALDSMNSEAPPPSKYSLQALARQRESLLKKIETLAFSRHMTADRHQVPSDQGDQSLATQRNDEVTQELFDATFFDESVARVVDDNQLDVLPSIEFMDSSFGNKLEVELVGTDILVGIDFTLNSSRGLEVKKGNDEMGPPYPTTHSSLSFESSDDEEQDISKSSKSLNHRSTSVCSNPDTGFHIKLVKKCDAEDGDGFLYLESPQSIKDFPYSATPTLSYSDDMKSCQILLGESIDTSISQPHLLTLEVESYPLDYMYPKMKDASFSRNAEWSRASLQFGASNGVYIFDPSAFRPDDSCNQAASDFLVATCLCLTQGFTRWSTAAVNVGIGRWTMGTVNKRNELAHFRDIQPMESTYLTQGQEPLTAQAEAQQLDTVASRLPAQSFPRNPDVE